MVVNFIILGGTIKIADNKKLRHIFGYLDKLNVSGVLIAAFLAALGSVFYSPAASTLMIDIIPRDDMTRGQSIFSGSNALINMVGTAFSGVMVAFFGVPLIVSINGLSNKK